MAYKNNNISGFTLAELSVVIVLAVMLITISVSVAQSRLEVQKIKTTQQRIVFIAKVIDEYVRTYGQLPCPADPTLPFDSASFGEGSGTGGASCSASNLISSGTIRVGAIPVKTLEIPDIMVLDGWERRFSYVVDQDLISETGFTSSLGSIIVTNAASVDISTQVASVIISHGKNMFGSWAKEGGTVRFSVTGGSSIEDENTDFDAIYVDVFRRSDFDDVVIYKNKWQLAQ